MVVGRSLEAALFSEPGETERLSGETRGVPVESDSGDWFTFSAREVVPLADADGVVMRDIDLET